MLFLNLKMWIMGNRIDIRDLTRKKQFTVDSDDNSVTQVQASCMLRIADAVEAMGANQIRMQHDLEWYKKQYNQQVKELETLRRRLAAQQGATTRLRNKMNKQSHSKSDTDAQD